MRDICGRWSGGMKTRTFKAVRFLASSLSVLLIACTFVLGGYLLRHVSFMQIEAEIMRSYVLTILNISKTAAFFHISIGLLTSYALNIPSKLVMLLNLYIAHAVMFGTLYILYYLGFEYSNHFSSTLDSEFYSRAGLIAIIRTWQPGLSAIELKAACKEMMKRMIFILTLYELLSILCLLSMSGLLILARRVKIEQDNPVEDAPLISELSKVGLNTCSLRNKRILVSS